MTEQNESEQELNITNVEQISFQPNFKVYRYKVKFENQNIVVSVISTNATDAKEGLKRQLPDNATITYDGVSDKIMQVH